MAMPKFSEGEWKRDCDAVSIAGQICIVAPGPDGASREELLANVNLIAASPDMFREIYKFPRVEDFANQTEWTEAVLEWESGARFALKKALGER